ncbi:alpha/beta hydrolase [Kibdelosporangium phytohabitans]|uniref:alpha/beta hydrolase n=1 Tax=Kibdelosporangium phytohabitans TaxID=860235 RepID=UPI000AEC2871|nr:alpha/beta hydrolase [Kibdelosporangium phytohabitans]MBE1469926.1 acetyl esterase/lipase [Kibdelosporangium phytohabitans]
MSWQARVLLATAWVTARPLIAALPQNETGVRLGRRGTAATLAVLSPTLPGTTITRVDEPRGEWVRAPGTSDDRVVFYLHGSAYTICSARTHRGLTSRLSAASGMPVFACDYRLAPSHRFPAAADDVRAAYDWLLEQGYRPGQIVLAGDSAGGHLAMDLTCELVKAGGPLPSGMALFSPAIDLTFALSARRGPRDPLISAARARRLVEHYTRDVDPTHPRLALSIPAGCPWPPTLVQVGGAEMLVADAEHIHQTVRAAGGDCELQVWPSQGHVFQVFAALLPEARTALARAGEFIKETS